MKILIMSLLSLMVVAGGCKSSSGSKPTPKAKNKNDDANRDEGGDGSGFDATLRIQASSGSSFTKSQTVRVPLSISGLNGSRSQVAIISAPSTASITNSQSTSPSFLWPTPTVGSTQVTVMVRNMDKCEREASNCSLPATIDASQVSYLYDAQTTFTVNVTNDGSGSLGGGSNGNVLSALLPIILQILGGENGSSALSSVLTPEMLKQLQGLLGNQVTTMTVSEFNEAYGQQPTQ